jgi:amino acid transporter
MLTERLISPSMDDNDDMERPLLPLRNGSGIMAPAPALENEDGFIEVPVSWTQFLMPTATKLDMFRGVFVPATIGIIGPTLFFCMAFVISQSGFLQTLLMIVFILVLSLMLLFGFSAIVTNGAMRAGGPYFLISRTLGPELGGAIGVLLILENIIASVFFLSTIGEIIFLSNQKQTPSSELTYEYTEEIAVSSICLFCCYLLTLLGVRTYSSVGVFFFLVKMTAVLIVLGSFLFRHGNPKPESFDDVCIYAFVCVCMCQCVRIYVRACM